MNILLIVDMQRDFLSGGSLAVPETRFLPQKIALESSYYDLVISTRDFHPGNHISFVDYGGQWPRHCVKGQPGAELHPMIDRITDVLISKGTRAEKESYSGFDGTHLADFLNGLMRSYHNSNGSMGQSELTITICGVALEICVKATALDSVARGFRTVLVPRLTRPLDSEAGERAIDEMRKAGVEIA